MPRTRPKRLAHIQGIGVDSMGDSGDAASTDLLRLENLDIDIPPHPLALARARELVNSDPANSYLPFVGQHRLRDAAAKHVSQTSGQHYTGDSNCVIVAGGLNGITNALLATVEEGDEVILTDPSYAGLINRVRLAGGCPKFVRLDFTLGEEWTLDHDSLRASITPGTTKAMLLMSPALPTGAYLTEEDWKVVSELCKAHDLWLIYDAAMERLLFDGKKVVHPASFPGMKERTITVGSASKELRMIGWRVGWIIAPESLIPDLAAVGMANVVVPVGVAQDAVAVALEEDDLKEYIEELQRRRDALMNDELKGLPVGKPAGGLSLVLRTDNAGSSAKSVSQRLMKGGVCATPMDGWGSGEVGEFVRFVYSNETPDRLQGLGAKVRAALENIEV